MEKRIFHRQHEGTRLSTSTAAMKELVAENPTLPSVPGEQQSLTHGLAGEDKQRLRKEAMKVHISPLKYPSTY